MNIYLATTVDTMFGALANLIDLNRTPNFADVPLGYAGFILVPLERTDQCTKEVDQEPVCETLSYASGSASWLGEVSWLVILKNGPTSKDDCKGGGWKAFGFKNQGQCVKYVTHLK